MRNRGLIVALVTLVALVLVGPILGGGMMGVGVGPGMMWGYGPGGTYGGAGWMWGAGMGIGSLSMLAFWGALIVGGILLYRALSGRHPEDRESAEEILKRRYAAGEITREQYDQMRQALHA